MRCAAAQAAAQALEQPVLPLLGHHGLVGHCWVCQPVPCTALSRSSGRHTTAHHCTTQASTTWHATPVTTPPL